jgi:hypothetical protein
LKTPSAATTRAQKQFQRNGAARQMRFALQPKTFATSCINSIK